MAKSERDEVLDELASRVFSTMLDDLILDAALQSHQEVARNRAVCDVCHTRCGLAHNAGPSTLAMNGRSRAGTPSLEGGGRMGTPTPGSSTPKSDGNMLLDCVVCGRQVASARYAPHLSGCMGMNGTRRGSSRNVTSKPKLPSESGRSASPYLDGDFEGEDIPLAMSKAKAPSKSKQKDDAPFSTKRKQTGSPSPPKKSKKAKTGASPLTRVATIPDIPGNPTNHFLSIPSNSQSKVPSRLRESSTAFLDRDRSSSPESASSPGTLPISAATPSSVHSIQTNGTKKGGGGAAVPSGFGRGAGVGAGRAKVQPRMPSPPRPPVTVVRKPDTDYLVDVEGDETGSSTDSSSD
ncbi:uncharacterized protein STEHIDRAFT_152134 [Stereum hirsutum FP-91666 SS1]|uniref:uncharacterized protein n=1 Tax=Stereum hirsutum (strain FP-91666) TaxID=721885 RepID=UPI000440D1BD|nr:uncharacterized protein STEHIDRAFT_152134 [Stereum hirsutum FP-91666 SS1]EIM92829.1 hypothetical protein STEHIDRAFT_152134 [Stereum hirsutum FP-91666 SS1]